MRIAHTKRATMTGLSHAGETFEADAHGAFDVPEEVADWFLDRFPHLWREADPIPETAQPAAPVAEQVETPADEPTGKGKAGRSAKATPVELAPAEQPPAE